MKVLLVNNLYPPRVAGGAERSVAILARALAGKGLDVAVATLHGSAKACTDDVDGIRVHVLPLRNIYWPYGSRRRPLARSLWHGFDTFNPLAAWDLGRVLSREKPDVVHTNNLAGFSPAVWLAARRFDIPLVHTLRDYYLLCPRTTMFQRGRNCESVCTACNTYSWPRKQLSRVPIGVVGISRFILERHFRAGHFENASIKTIIFNANEGVANEHQHTLPQDGIIRFGYLGRLHPSKGIEFLLQAFQNIQCDRWRLTIAGRGDPAYENDLRTRYAYDNVRFEGWTEADDLLGQVDVLAVPSLWHEPMSRVVVEAYARGVPVIGSTRGGIPELIEPGVTGLLFDPDLPGSLVATIQSVLDDPDQLRAMAVRCTEKARSFEPAITAEQYLRVYDEALGRASQRALGRVPDAPL